MQFWIHRLWGGGISEDRGGKLAWGGGVMEGKGEGRTVQWPSPLLPLFSSMPPAAADDVNVQLSQTAYVTSVGLIEIQ